MSDTSPRLALKTAHRKLGLWLAFVAGAINAAGFILIGHYTSHMTGIASSVGDALAINNLRAALAALMFLACFIGGAVTTALLVNHMRDRRAGEEYRAVLLLEAALLALFIALASSAAPLWLLIALPCFLMGLQNALITKISGAIIRTTHVTGLATDLGIELGRALYQRLSGNANMTLHPDKIRLTAMLLGSFITGGIAGAFGAVHLSALSLLPLCVILLWLSRDIHRTS